MHADTRGSHGAATGAAVTGAGRLSHLRLETAALDAMRRFYGETLGLPVLAQREDQFTVVAGGTRITFSRVASGDGQDAAASEPFYHFAFNIPEDKILAAHDWQRKRTPLIAAPERLCDARYPNDVIDYAHWNAHSIFFWDPGGNLVEYIARHDLRNGAPGPFTSADVLYASEIAFVADDVPAMGRQIQTAFDLPQYRGGSDQFRAIGDELGLLLVFGRGRPQGFAEAKPAGVFTTEATVRTGSTHHLTFTDFPYDITSD